MKILLDECVTKKLRDLLVNHEVLTVTQMKWNGLRNGFLMDEAVKEKFDLLTTIDKNLRFQQNVQKKELIVVIFDSPSSKINELQKFIPGFLNTVNTFEKKKVYVIPSP